MEVQHYNHNKLIFGSWKSSIKIIITAYMRLSVVTLSFFFFMYHILELFLWKQSTKVLELLWIVEVVKLSWIAEVVNFCVWLLTLTRRWGCNDSLLSRFP
jgi:hypothetical protein